MALGPPCPALRGPCPEQLGMVKGAGAVVCVIQAPLAFSAPLGCPEQHQTGPQV